MSSTEQVPNLKQSPSTDHPPVAPSAKVKSKKKKKKKGIAPPFQTFEVVTSNGEDGGYTTLRMVTSIDVLLVDNNNNNNNSHNKELYDFTRHPGNIRCRKFVKLSLSKLDALTTETATREDLEEGFAERVVKTTREQFGALFLKRVDPANVNCTQWVEAGNPESTQEVLQMYRNQKAKQLPSIKTERIVKTEAPPPQLEWQRQPHANGHDDPVLQQPPPQEFPQPSPTQNTQEDLQNQQDTQTQQDQFPEPMQEDPVEQPIHQEQPALHQQDNQLQLNHHDEPMEQDPVEQPMHQELQDQQPMSLAALPEPMGPASPGSVAGLGIVHEAHVQQAIFAARDTPSGKTDNPSSVAAATPPLGLMTQFPPIPNSAVLSPGMAFVQQLPTTPAMPPLMGTAPERQSMTPACPDLPALPGMANPSTVPEQAVDPLGTKPTSLKKPPPEQPTTAQPVSDQPVPVKRKRGRPRKGEIVPPKPKYVGPKRKRGRPRKYPLPPQKLIDRPPAKSKEAGDANELPITRDARGRNRLVALPNPRKAPTVAPPPLSPGPEATQGDGSFLLSPTSKKDTEFDFNLHASPNFVFAEDSPKQKRGTLTFISPPKPATEFPFPSPPAPKTTQSSPQPVDDHGSTASQVEQAKNYLKIKDPIWLSMYAQLEAARVTLYSLGHTDKWVSGNVRQAQRMKPDMHGDEQPLNHWVLDQQEMYREHCAWEEAKHQERTQQMLLQSTAAKTGGAEASGTAQATQVDSEDSNGTTTKKAPAKPRGAGSSETVTETGTDEAPENSGKANSTKLAMTKEGKQAATSSAKGHAKARNKRKKAPLTCAENEPSKLRSLRSRISRKRTKQRLPRAAKTKQGSDDDEDDANKDESNKIASIESSGTPEAPLGDKEANESNQKPNAKNPTAVADEKAQTSNSEAQSTTEVRPPAQENATSDTGENGKTGPGEGIAAEQTSKPTGEETSVVPTVAQGASNAGKVNDPDDPWELPPLNHAAESLGEPESLGQPESCVPDDKVNSEQRIQKIREMQRAKILLLDDIHFIWQPDQEPPADAPQEWKDSFYDLREYVRSRGDTAVSDSVELGSWAQLQRMKYQRSMTMMTKTSVATGETPPTQAPPLSRGQMAALRGIGFDWDDLESSQFYVMYLKLVEFIHRVGDGMVPPPIRFFREDDIDDDDVMVATRADPKLYFWVQRQRYEHVRFLRAKEIAEQRAAGVDEDGHALVLQLLEEEEQSVEHSSKRRKTADDNDDCTVIADLVGTPGKHLLNGNTGMTSSSIDADKENEQNGKPIKTRKRHTKSRRDPLSKAKAGLRKNTVILQSSDAVSTLTQAQVDLLTRAGFIWATDLSFNWMYQYRRLQAFFIKNGHSRATRAATDASLKLNRWCTNMRTLHQRSIKGLEFGMSLEKQKLLAKLDFRFEFEDMPERVSFDERYQWLVKYKEEEGHVNVPQKHPTLGHFVKRLRKEYLSYSRGEKYMNPRKIQLLNEIGFNWSVRNHQGFRRANKPRYKEVEDDDYDEEDDFMVAERSPPPKNDKLRTESIVANAVSKKASSVSENECIGCYGTIIFASAKCESCRGVYCHNCFDEVCTNDQECTKCMGTVISTS
ncbi:Type III restriction enzyme, res subunit [Seminavis robusta]|uniref:Type III restriction enzyme, res subunit n=1 Tax=Seminavis robusta TaxID=568900 RepID=A0A9N8ENQ1_9STRA|nr:Type III restriction enzyme, res subunit [Seminavis robusta]|eukprot:Sro1329_g263310.1 Type III restriction enzyme, res subunit (1596) ;mRNA; r:9272-14310